MFFLDTYFLVNWLEEEEDDLYDVMSSKCVVPPDDHSILEITSDDGLPGSDNIIRHGKLIVVSLPL